MGEGKIKEEKKIPFNFNMNTTEEKQRKKICLCCKPFGYN